MLERRPRPQGRVLVDHPHGGHDDYANVTCLAIAALAKTQPQPFFFFSGGRVISSSVPVPHETETQDAPVLSRITSTMQAAGETVKDTVTAATNAITRALHTPARSAPVPARRRSFEEMQNLMRGDLTEAEQQQFDVELERRRRNRQPSALEQQVRAGNIYWPSDGPPATSPSDLAAVMEETRRKFAMWR